MKSPGAQRVKGRSVAVAVVRRFRRGFLCAEAVAGAVLEDAGREVTPGMLRMASGFSGGCGGCGQELCGAFTGGVLALGEILGRDRPGEELRELGRRVRSFREWFIEEQGSLNCAELLADFEDEERGPACVALSAEAAVKLSVMLRNDPPPSGFGHPREVVPVGACPFAEPVRVRDPNDSIRSEPA